MKDSIAACQKWAKSGFLRMSIISDTYLEYALTGREDIRNDLHHYKSQKNNDSLNRIMAMVKDTLNHSMRILIKKSCIILKQGRPSSSNTEEFMLSIKTNGENLRRNFIKECVLDPSRFENLSKNRKCILLQQNLGRKK